MAGIDPGISNLIIFVLAIFVGCYVVSGTSHSLHKTLTVMIGTFSGVIVVGAMFAAGAGHISFSTIVGFFAVTLAAINIVGGFALTQRVLTTSRDQH